MASPLTDLILASRTFEGRTVSEAGWFRVEGWLLVAPPLGLGPPAVAGSCSFELQLEMPRAATSDSTTTVNASRVGVQKFFIAPPAVL